MRALFVQNERIPNGWSDARAPVARSLFIHVCRRSPIATSIKEKRKSVYEKKKNTTTGIDHRNDVLRAPSGTRTLDTLIKSQVLYQLS